MRNFFCYILFFLFFYSYTVSAQDVFSRNYMIFNKKMIDINSEFNILNNINSDFHTSIRPLIEFRYDTSFYHTDIQSLFYKKLKNEDLYRIKGQGYNLKFNPIDNFQIGKETSSDKILWVNTRGFYFKGNFRERFTFYSSFLENQSVFPKYITNSVVAQTAWVVPGQGESRWSSDSLFDYAMASGNLSYKISDFSSIQFGTGKHFIGDGYRSMILSDNSFNYPYLRINTNFGPFQYKNLYMEHIDMTSNPSQEYTYDRKYMSLHFLNINVNKRLHIGLFESIVWKNNRTPEISGFDLAYLNPIIFLRPIEFSINSSDNALMGVNLKYKMTDRSYFYSQFVIDEFSLPDLNYDINWWGNKYAYQIGMKYYRFLGVNNLFVQIENNFARPYTYSHSDVAQNYGHYFQSLAHPLGANFNEILLFLDYKYNAWEFHFQIMRAKYGTKKINDPTSFGDDIFISNSNRPSDNNILMYQGNMTKLNYNKFVISHTINSITNLKLESGYVFRHLNNDDGKNITNFFFFALKSDLFNRYYDF